VLLFLLRGVASEGADESSMAILSMSDRVPAGGNGSRWAPAGDVMSM
jgi:hypothetical protein